MPALPQRGQVPAGDGAAACLSPCGSTDGVFRPTNLPFPQNTQDWKKKHELDRKQITEVVCALCETRQPVGDHCAACDVSFGGLAGGQEAALFWA